MNFNLTDYVGMIRNWWSTIGIFLLLEGLQYFIDNLAFSWRGLAVAVAAAFIKHSVTSFDHTVAKKAVEKAAVTGEVPASITAGEHK
ncbi:MAG: hypothetical protein H0X33_13295 [Taibaiella sp.]|nr:hypothetical protein [Taibaiella sp.]